MRVTSSRRVVVTGLGVVSPLGLGANAFWQGLSQGTCAITTLTQFPELRLKTGAWMTDYDGSAHFEKAALTTLDPFAQYFVLAGRQALADSGFEPGPDEGLRTAVISGTASGGQMTQDEESQRLYLQNRPRVMPLTVPRVMANSGASGLAAETGLMGPCFTLSTACSSANHAIGMAFWMIRQGAVDRALTGGSEAPFAVGNLRAWEATRAVDPEPCRPFSADRQGLSLGEGGAVLMLEELSLAQARGARIYGEVLGFGMSADAHHVVRPLAEGAALAMRAALSDAGLDPSAVDHINAHGTGTPLNDATESSAIREVFGNHADQVLVTSTKSMHGHTLGAAGALEACATLLALHHRLIPPTIHHQQDDPECPVRVVTGQALEAPIKTAISNSFAFGGLNAVLALGAY
ncbi:MAG: beta-ketoacyl-[acyl-carrier-protein] synthase family protein [Candidatus Eremiobacteraeota bacterium]|nr:beta-ketoacyl-[acyl-carrier-protein] synthase family protein [Candidatus Eremiobacteraeota bacterium]